MFGYGIQEFLGFAADSKSSSENGPKNIVELGAEVN